MLIAVHSRQVSAEALNFLEAHGAVVENHVNVLLVDLPADARVEETFFSQEYTVKFDLDPTYVHYELAADVYETRIALRTPSEILNK